MRGYGAALPLNFNSTDGPYALLKDLKSIIFQNLKMIVLTSPGERIMDPNFGVGMRRFLFEQNNNDTHSRIKAKIKKQVSEYMSFVLIEDVIFGYENNNPLIKSNGLLVTIKFFISPVGVAGSLGIEL